MSKLTHMLGNTLKVQLAPSATKNIKLYFNAEPEAFILDILKGNNPDGSIENCEGPALKIIVDYTKPQTDDEKRLGLESVCTMFVGFIVHKHPYRMLNDDSIEGIQLIAQENELIPAVTPQKLVNAFRR